MKNYSHYQINQISSDFDSSVFEQVAVIQAQTAQQLLSRLEWIDIRPKNIVNISYESRYGAELLAKRYPDAIVHNNAVKVKTIDDHSIDLIFSNLWLSAQNELVKYISEWRRILKPNGVLIFSMLGPDSFIELKESWKGVDNFQHVHDFIDMHEVGDLLLQQQFVDPVMDVEIVTLLYKDEKDLIKDLRMQGARNFQARNLKSLCGKQRFNAFIENYKKYITLENKLPLTCEIIYGHALGGDFAVSAVNDPAEVTDIPISRLLRRRYSSS